MGNVAYKQRMFINKPHTFLLRADEDLFQKVVKIANKRHLSINAILNEAITKYVENKA